MTDELRKKIEDLATQLEVVKAICIQLIMAHYKIEYDRAKQRLERMIGSKDISKGASHDR